MELFNAVCIRSCFIYGVIDYLGALGATAMQFVGTIKVTFIIWCCLYYGLWSVVLDYLVPLSALALF